MFTKIAPTYDVINRRLSFAHDQRWRQQAIANLTSKLDYRILDLCAGTMDMTAALLQQFPHAQITAVDFSQAMLNHGRSKIPSVFRPHVDVRCEDVLNLSLPDRSMDAVVCAFGMRNLPDQVRALRQIARVLIPGGEFVILEFFQPTNFLSRLFSMTYGKFLVPLLGKLMSHHPEAYTYLHRSTINFYPLTAYRALLEVNGFTVKKSEALSGGIAHILVANRLVGNST